LLHYSRRREPASERAPRIVRDLASASGIEVPSRHEAELMAFIRGYLTDVFRSADNLATPCQPARRSEDRIGFLTIDSGQA